MLQLRFVLRRQRRRDVAARLPRAARCTLRAFKLWKMGVARYPNSSDCLALKYDSRVYPMTSSFSPSALASVRSRRPNEFI